MLALTFTINVLLIFIFTRLALYYVKSESLQMVFTTFRHGHRANDRGTTYPNDPYLNETYEPYGWGELTNEGKEREYKLGEFLHNRYIALLGTIYKKEKIRAISTDYSRTKESLQLVLASLYPPKFTALEWNKNLNWNPIAYDSVKLATDRLLSIAIIYCPRYIKIFNEYLTSDEGRKIEENYNTQYDYISQHSGLKILHLFDLFRLYFCLVAESEWGLKLPEWTNPVFPGYLSRTTMKSYEMLVAKPELNQLFGGFLLNDIITEMRAKINGDPALAERKMNLYSGHELNIAALLGALNVYYPHVPTYGACLIIELHKEEQQYFVKILYKDWTSATLKRLTVPGCSYQCHFDDFVAILNKNLPNVQNGDPCVIT